VGLGNSLATMSWAVAASTLLSAARTFQFRDNAISFTTASVSALVCARAGNVRAAVNNAARINFTSRKVRHRRDDVCEAKP
jgi:hypothetical protein